MLTIEHFGKMIQSDDAVSLAAFGYVELLEKKWISTIPIHYSYPAIVAYVAPAYRRLGVHRELFTALKTKAKELKRRFIGSGIHINNLGMLAAAKAEEREIYSVITSYNII